MAPNERSIAPAALIAAAQTLTGGEVALGGAIDCRGKTKLTIFIDLDINDSTTVYIILYGQHANGGDNFEPVRMATLGYSDAFSYKYIFSNADQKRMLVFELCGAVPFIQAMVKAGVVGATAGKVLAAKYVLG